MAFVLRTRRTVMKYVLSLLIALHLSVLFSAVGCKTGSSSDSSAAYVGVGGASRKVTNDPAILHRREETQRLQKEAAIALRTNDFGGAEDLLREALVLDPDSKTL